MTMYLRYVSDMTTKSIPEAECEAHRRRMNRKLPKITETDTAMITALEGLPPGGGWLAILELWWYVMLGIRSRIPCVGSDEDAANAVTWRMWK